MRILFHFNNPFLNFTLTALILHSQLYKTHKNINYQFWYLQVECITGILKRTRQYI